MFPGSQLVSLCCYWGCGLSLVFLMTFAKDILEEAGDEPIEAIAVSKMRGYSWDEETDHSLGCSPVAWADAFPVLNYEYDEGFGGQDCHDIWAWTPTRVLFVHEYDGATRIASAPRFPTDFTVATQ